MPQAPNEIALRYHDIWREFVQRCAAFHLELVEDTDQNLHDILTGLQGVPYSQLHALLKSSRKDRSSENIGSVTGFFFEYSATELLISTIRTRFHDAVFERNTCSTDITRGVARDPDLYIKRGDREVVVEIKASPKKKELDHTAVLYDRYKQVGIRYVLVGGYVSVRRADLEPFVDRDWACFTHSSKRNAEVLERLPRFDTIVGRICTHLSGA